MRDESAEDIRIVIEPRTRNLDPAALMESLFRNSDLETRFSINMNALIDGLVPKVCSLKEVLSAFLTHRREVLRRRSKHRMEKIELRLEILEGFNCAFINLDRVIEIIRFEDFPKRTLMEEFTLTENQADAILNMRLRSLRKLEELELRKEYDGLTLEHAELDKLLESEALQWTRIADQIKETKKKFGANSPNGARRTVFAEAAPIEALPMETAAESEPVTVICSAKGWIRSMKGSVPLDQEFKFRDGDEAGFAFHAESTDKILLFGTNGRFYTLQASALPGGRGLGEPLRLMVDLPNDAAVVALFVHDSERKLLVASTDSVGFIVNESDALAATRNGKQILNARPPNTAGFCVFVEGDHVALVSTDGKLLILHVSDLPEMSRGVGNRLQKLQDGKCSDITVFSGETGLRWQDAGGRTRTVKDFGAWLGKRNSVGKKTPHGFPKDNRFS